MQTTDTPTRTDMIVARTMADAEAYRAVVRANRISRWLRETECPECRGPMAPAPAHKAEPGVGIKAFAGGFECTECGMEVED